MQSKSCFLSQQIFENKIAFKSSFVPTDCFTKLKELGPYGRHVNTSDSQLWLHCILRITREGFKYPFQAISQLNWNWEEEVGELN